MRVLLVAHGYPPRETAGTEQHTAALAEGLRARGHAVHVLAATRAPGERQYSVIEEPGITRIVNNVPARPLVQAERDRAVEAIAARVEESFRPDVVHVQHSQFLSSGLRWKAPWGVTLHDQWAWCAAGGAGLLPDRTVCAGPSPERCAPCAAAWRPTPGRVESGLMATAGALAPLVAPEKLHALYQRLPERLRLPVRRGAGPVETPEAAAARNAAVGALYREAAFRISPSRYLADLAELRGLGPVTVVPHGVAPGRPGTGDGPLLFLGTIAWHKGPDLVVNAWRRAFPGGEPPLVLHGPVLDANAAARHPVGRVLSREEVAAALAGARALVLGSRWPENAPLVVLEARAVGCPVIAPDLGGLPELVEHGRDGLLYPPGDEAALAAAMKEIVSGSRLMPRLPPTLDEQVEATLMVYGAARAPACSG